MRRLAFVFILLIIIISGSIYFMQHASFQFDKDLIFRAEEPLPKIKSDQETKEVLPILEGDVFDYIGEKGSVLKSELGEPDRRDASAYGYTWWVYTDEVTDYIQFGVQDDKIVTIFATGEDMESKPFTIGDSYEKLDDSFHFEDKVSYHDGLSFYHFMLSDQDLKTAPLVKLSEDTFVQCYFDTFVGELSAIRVITGDTLLKHRAYEMEYRGDLPDKPTFDTEQWSKIEEGMEEQIFDLTNVYRNRFNVMPVVKDENVQEVAYDHSKDMQKNNYFSHYSEDGSGLKERLEKKNIYYLTAGENIAAQHIDGPAAIEGWLNSEGHREALLNDEYTHLGVGVYQLYYTQNFLFKP